MHTDVTDTMGLATQERRSRLVRILSGLPKSRLRLHAANRRSRFTSVLHVAFEDTTLTQCNFYLVLKWDAIRGRPLLVHTCTYTLIVVFKSIAHAAIYAVQKIWRKSRYDLDLASPLRIRIDLDLCSRVVSPYVILNWYASLGEILKILHSQSSTKWLLASCLYFYQLCGNFYGKMCEMEEQPTFSCIQNSIATILDKIVAKKFTPYLLVKWPHTPAPTKKSESPWLKLMSHWFVRITKHLKNHLSHHDSLKWVWLL